MNYVYNGWYRTTGTELVPEGGLGRPLWVPNVGSCLLRVNTEIESKTVSRGERVDETKRKTFG